MKNNIKQKIIEHLSEIESEDPNSMVNYNVGLSSKDLLNDDLMKEVLRELMYDGFIDYGYKGENDGEWIIVRK